MRMRSVLVAVVLSSLLTVSASATPIGYWRLEDGLVGTQATTLNSTVNNGVLQGQEGGTGSGSMFFSSDIPGKFIQDGVGGDFVSNTSSLFTERTGNNRIDVDDNTTALHEPTDFTYELFVKSDQSDVSQFQVITRKRRGSTGSSWSISSFNDGNLQLRVDSEASIGVDPGFNEAIGPDVSLTDGEWHHIAVTYNGSTNQFELFNDYASVGTLTAVPAGIVYDGGPLTIGGRSNGNGWNGWIDEARLSDTVLTPDQFLRTGFPIPEPSSMMLVLVGGLGLLRHKKRRRRRATSP